MYVTLYKLHNYLLKIQAVDHDIVRYTYVCEFSKKQSRTIYFHKVKVQFTTRRCKVIKWIMSRSFDACWQNGEESDLKISWNMQEVWYVDKITTSFRVTVKNFLTIWLSSALCFDCLCSILAALVSFSWESEVCYFDVKF